MKTIFYVLTALTFSLVAEAQVSYVCSDGNNKFQIDLNSNGVATGVKINSNDTSIKRIQDCTNRAVKKCSNISFTTTLDTLRFSIPLSTRLSPTAEYKSRNLGRPLKMNCSVATADNTNATSPTTIPTVVAPIPAPTMDRGEKSCGMTGTIEERIANCSTQKTTTQEYTWSLVARDSSGYEVWRDDQSLVYWSDLSREYITAKEGSKKDSDACTEKNDMLKEFKLETLKWRLPLLEDYTLADYYEFKEVLPSLFGARNLTQSAREYDGVSYLAVVNLVSPTLSWANADIKGKLKFSYRCVADSE